MNLDYQKLLFFQNKWGYESINLIKNLLEVDEKHKLVITNPNLIFNRKVLTLENNELTEINCDLLKEDLSEVEKNSYTSISSDATIPFSYISKRLNFEIHNKYNNPKYLIVLEFDFEHNYQIKGVFKATRKDIYIALNPYYEKDLKFKTKKLAI